MVKIDQKIVGYNVVKPDEVAPPIIQKMDESVKRSVALQGVTYKIKPPTVDHAFYITINNTTVDGVQYPFEMFVNSKDMENFQWIVALTRLVSAVFRKGGDVTFLIDELMSVFDPKGGYFKPGGKYMPSLVSEIGEVIKTHLISIGSMQDDELDQHQKEFIAKKRKEFAAQDKLVVETPEFSDVGLGLGLGDATTEEGDFPDSAQLCGKCHAKAAVLMDGCMTCLNCADSKCG